MRKQNLVYVRVTAITLSCLVASLTLCNLFTVITHGIDFEIPDENDFSWAIDPSEKRLLILTGFMVNNHGAYDIDDIDITASISNEEGKTLIEFSELDMAVSRGTDKRFEIMITVDLDEIDIVDWFSLIYRNTVLNLTIDIDVDYMFGLIHVTVDETLSYHWTAPLSDYRWNDGFFDGLASLLRFSRLDYDFDITEVEVALMDYIMSVGSFEYSNGEGLTFWYNNTDGYGELRNLSCEFIVPIESIEGNLAVGFATSVGIIGDAPIVSLQEVYVRYVKK